jgi:hypothetical protein
MLLVSAGQQLQSDRILFVLATLEIRGAHACTGVTNDETKNFTPHRDDDFPHEFPRFAKYCGNCKNDFHFHVSYLKHNPHNYI